MDKRQLAKARMRVKILAAAEKLFRKKGYANTKTREIAKLAGHSTGAIYNSWKTLDELWKEVTGLPVPGSSPWEGEAKWTADLPE